MRDLSLMLRLALSFLSICLVLAQGADARPRGTVPANSFNGGGIQINSNLASYYTGMHKYLNWWSAGDTVQVVSSLNGTLVGKSAWDALGASSQAYFNSSTGELNVPVQSDVTSYGRGVFQDPSAANRVPNGLYGPPNVGSSGAQGKWWLGQVWNLEWTGTISTAGTKITNSGSYGTGGSPGLGTVGDCGTNCITVTFGNATSASNLALFFVIDASNRSDPPRNIKFYPSQFATQARSADLATSLLNPDWLAQWGIAGKSGVGKIRYMVENGGDTNIFGATAFSQLAEYTYNTFSQIGGLPGYGTGGFVGQAYTAGYNGPYGPKGGIGPLTVCVQSNKIGADAHYTLPYAFTTTATFQLAQAFDGCMNVGLTVDYEYCNEIFNFGANFFCYRYNRRQPYPPIGASSPFQQAVTINSITPGNPTTINVTSNPYSNGTQIAFSISGGDTIATALSADDTNAQGPFAVGGATGTTFTVPVDTTGLSYSSGGTVYLVDGGGGTRGGYNAAKLMDQVYDAYGASKRSRWRGILGGQLTASGSFLQSAIDGAMFYITNESVGTGACAPKKCFQELFNKAEIAPYAGNSAYNGTPVTAVTKSATPTVTAAGHTFTNGQTIRFYVLTGMTQLNSQTATVSGVSGSNFNINIDTTAFSTWSTGNGNFAIDNALPKAAEDSIALNGSTPGTYPTRYSYFAEQMSDAILNGTSVSNPSFGYTIQSDGNYRSYASCGTSCIPGIMLVNALIAKRYGMTLDEYEGARFSTYVDTNGTYIKASGNSAADQLYDFFYNWQYDAGTATKGPADIESAHITAGQAAGISMPSLFDEVGPGPNPFHATRYFGDVPSAISRMYTQNAAGPYTEPYTPPAWTATYAGNATNRYFSSGACVGCTDTLATTVIGTAATRAFVMVTLGAGSITSVTCDGVTVTTPDATSLNGGRTAAIYSMALNAGTNVRNCSMVTSGASFQFREFYVATVNGLLSGTPTAASTGNPGTTFSINYTGGNLLVAASACSLASGAFANTSGVSTPTAANPVSTVLALDSDNSGGRIAQFMMMYAPFSSPLFSVAPGCNQASAGAVYR